MRKTLKGAGAAALAAATVVSGLSFGSAAASAAPKSTSPASTEVKLIFKDGANFVRSGDLTQTGINYSYVRTFSSLATALNGAYTYQVERLNDGWLRLRPSGSSSCLHAYTWGNASEPALDTHPSGSCGGTTSQWRLNNGKLENRAAGFVGKTFSYVNGTNGYRITHIGFTGQTGGWQLAGDVSPLNPVTNGGVTAAGNPDTMLTRGASVAVPFAMRATATYNTVNSSTVTFTAPANTVFTPGQSVRGQWRATPSSAWNLQANLNLTNVTISNGGKTLTGNFASPSSFEQGTNHELGWLPMVTANADSAAGQGTMTAAATGSTNLGNFTVNGSTKTTISDNGGFFGAGVGHAATVERNQVVDVSIGMKANAQATRQGTTSVTITAPAGTRFPADLTRLTGSYKTSGGSWVASPNINVTGSVSADGRTFTGTIPSNADEATFQANSEGRWTGKLQGDANALGGVRNLGFAVTGTSNTGAFSVTGNSAITVDAPVHDNGGYASAGVGHPATVLGGQEVDAYVGLKSEAAVTAMNGTNATLTAPAGTTFVAGQTAISGEYKEPDAEWQASTSLQLNGTVSADGRTFTGTIPNSAAAFKMLPDYQARWGIKLTAPANTDDGSGNLAFTVSGTTNIGAFTVNGNSAITIKKSTTALTASVGRIDNVKKEAAVSGKATANAEIKHGSRVIATADANGDWSGALTDLALGENTVALSQHVGGAKVDEKSVTVTIVTILNDGNGPDTSLKRGADTRVFAHVGIDADFTAVNNGKVTFTAPAGTTFTAGQDTVTGEFKGKDGGWTATQRLNLTGGTLSDDNTKYTYGWGSDSGLTFPKDGEIRWGIQVSTPATGDAIDATLRYAVEGSSNKGTFAAKGSTKATASAAAENGGFTAAGIGAAASVKQGEQTEVRFGLGADQKVTLDGATQITLTAPAGTSFPTDLKSLTSQYKTPAGAWVASPNITVTGSVSADGKTFTGTIPADAPEATFQAGSEGRWTAKLDAAKDATIGTRDLGFTISGTTTLGAFTVAGKSPITVQEGEADVTPVAVTAPATGAKVETPRPVFEGTGDEGATIEIRGSSRVVATTTVQDGKWSVPASVDLADGSYNLRVTQTAVNGAVSTATASFTIAAKVVVTPVKVTAPAAGSVTDKNQPTFTGTGHEGATVIIRGSVTELGRAIVKDGKWELTSGVRLANGDYDFYVVQVPTKGESTTIRHKITVNNPITAPITVTTPKQGGSSLAEVDTLRPVFQGTATPYAEITIGSSRTTIASTTADAKGNWTAITDRDLEAGGTYKLTATQAKGGKTNTTAADFVVSSKASAIKPLVLTAPGQNSTVNTLRPVFEGTATPFAKITVGSSRVTIAEGEADKDGKWTAVTNRDLERGGTYNGLTVRQTTTDNRTSTATASFTVARDAGSDQLDPITVSKPTDGEVVTTVRPTFVGKATPGAAITIGSSKTTVATGTADQNGDFSLESLIDLARGGTYTGLTVKQVKDGATSSTTISFSVARNAEGSDSLRPMSVSKPTDGEVVTTVRPTFVGKATPGAAITIGSSKTTVATGTADQNGDFTLESLIDLARGGTYTGLTVKQEKDGQKSEIKINFSIDRNAS